MAERYELRGELGRGSSATVYRAFDRALERECALKVARADAGELLSQEHRVLMQLAAAGHPNLPWVGELLTSHEVAAPLSAGGVGFALELVCGTDFVSWVRGEPRRVATEEPEAVAFGQEINTRAESTYRPPSAGGFERARDGLRQLAGALMAAHERGVVHRDLQPENVRVSDHGRVVVVDFGLALQHDNATTTSVGTTSYMAPEQWETSNTSPAADWYAVGLLLFEALTGQLPFSGSAYEVLLRKRTVGAPGPGLYVREVPPDLDDLCQRLLRSTPDRRANGHDVMEL